MLNGVLVRILGKLFIVSIRFYQICISPLFIPSCRFYPSCSEYAILSIRRHGPFRGILEGMKRLFRCHPLHPGGYDPVK